MNGRNKENVIVTLSDKRLLGIEDFCIYASVGRNSAIDLANASGAIFRVGKRVLIDRVKFDRYCDENSELE